MRYFAYCTRCRRFTIRKGGSPVCTRCDRNT